MSDPPDDWIDAERPDPYVGTVIADRYRIIYKLGQGGIGVVYLAEHIHIEKRVAIKLLAEHLSLSPGLIPNLLQEAKTTAKIRHENIVDITDFGKTELGNVFLVMEYLEGRSLSDEITSGGPIPVARVRTIMAQVFSALSAAHAKDIIHRDLKPENLFLITVDKRVDFVKVLDFGLSSMRTLGEKRHSAVGSELVGTPHYMSPEQIQGEPPDRSFDIYAAGCVVYEMLTGKPAFDAATVVGILLKQVRENPPPPSQRAPRGTVSQRLERISKMVD